MDRESSELQESGRQLVYFAAERTLLAWIRAAVALMALGFVVDRFGLFLREVAKAQGWRMGAAALATWPGTTIVLTGVAVNVVAAVRYGRFARRLARGDAEPGLGLPLAVGLSLALGLVGVGLALYLQRVTS